MRKFLIINQLKVTLGLLLLALVNARADEGLNERDRFRNFISQFVLCGAETNSPKGVECIRSAIRGEPLSIKWIADPDRLELLFQASRMDEEAKPLVKRVRSVLQTNAEPFLKQIQNMDATMGPAELKKFILGIGVPAAGIIGSKFDTEMVDQIIAKIDPKTLEQIYTESHALLQKFQPKDIKAFSGFFGSIDSSTQKASARVQQLTRNILEDYFTSLTIHEKSKIISDYFRASLDVASADRLRPLLQNLDPVMQKILQLFGRTMKDPTLEEAVSILQSSIEPFPFETMKAKVEERYGVAFDSLFKDYDVSKIRRATTGQVLFATHIASGERVAIKVRIPEILIAFESAKDRLLGLKSVQDNPGLKNFVSSLLEIIRVELDYRNEGKFTDLAQASYTDKRRKISPIKRVKYFKPEEDLAIYGFASGTKPTKLTALEDLKVRSKLVRNLIDLWAESAFFKNIKSTNGEYALTTLFHGDLHPGNILIDTATGQLVVLDFGNVGFFPLAERRSYIELFIGSMDSDPNGILEAVKRIYGTTAVKATDFDQIKKIAQEVWRNPALKDRRLDSFLSRAIDEVGLPVEKSVSSLIRGMGFLRIEANEVDRLLNELDPTGKVPRVDFGGAMKSSVVRNLKTEFPKTLFGSEDEALLNRELLGKAIKSYFNSKFIYPCKEFLGMAK